jgi:hypothetical protein
MRKKPDVDVTFDTGRIVFSYLTLIKFTGAAEPGN